MSKKLKRLGALIAASISGSSAAMEESPSLVDETSFTNDNEFEPSVLNHDVSQILAGHRSHSSHRSHQSHRSSSGGGSYSRPAPAPRPTPQSDPVGQDTRPSSSYPSASASDEAALQKKLQDKEARKNIIMRMQLTLQFEGYYKGAVDGIMGDQTRQAVLAYKRAKGISGSSVLDAATLNSMGITGF